LARGLGGISYRLHRDALEMMHMIKNLPDAIDSDYP
jgi:hypothetical protein